MGLQQSLTVLAILTSASACTLPENKESINDQAFINTMSLDAPNLEARNDQSQTDVHPSVHECSGFWESFENSGFMPSASGITCPAGYLQFPQYVSSLKVNGGRYNHFH